MNSKPHVDESPSAGGRSTRIPGWKDLARWDRRSNCGARRARCRVGLGRRVRCLGPTICRVDINDERADGD